MQKSKKEVNLQTKTKPIRVGNLIAKAPVQFKQYGGLSGGTQWIRYGDQDSLPAECLFYTWSSATAKECNRLITSFLYGNGVIDKQLGLLKINKKQTLNQFYKEACKSLVAFGGVAYRVNYNPFDLSKKEVFVVPINELRKYNDGSFIWSPYFNRPEGYTVEKIEGIPPYDKEYTEEYIFNELARQVKLFGYSYGFIHLHYEKEFQIPDYPVPAYYAGLELLQNQKHLIYAERKVAITGGMPASVITIIGNPDETQGVYTNSEANKLAETVRSISQPENDANVILLSAESQEAMPKVDVLGTTRNMNELGDMIDNNARRICEAFGVPPILLGYSKQGSLSNSTEFKNQLALFNKDIIARQEEIKEGVAYVIPELTFEVEQLNPFEYLQPELLEVLTPNEKRKLAGYEPIEEREKTVLESISTLSPLIANKILEALSIDEQRELIGLGPINTNNSIAAQIRAEFNRIDGIKYSPEDKERIYQDYFKAVNMTYSELERWSNNECSRAASSRQPINRNLELLNINKSDWTEKHYRWANRTIAFIGRMSKVEQGDLVCGKYSKRDISLKNWAFDHNKK